MARTDRDCDDPDRYLAGVNGEGTAGVTTFIVCAVVFVGCFLLAWRLSQFLKRCDERSETFVTDAAGYAAVKEAERITREAAR